jgi:CRP-like cAMP-binding protein
MTSIQELLAGCECPVFDGLAPDAMALVAGCGRLAEFGAGEVILAEGLPAEAVYVVRTGRVALEISSPQRGPLLIQTLGPGEVLGLSWLLPPYRWMFDGRAVEATSAVAIDAACLRAKCDGDPALGYEIYKRFTGLLRDRLQATRLQLLDLYGHHVS